MEKVPFSDWLKIDLRTAKILDVQDIEGKDNLFKLEVEIGKEKKTLVAGIKGFYSKKELVGKTIIVFSNLEPKKIAGVVGEGMLLAAVDKGAPILLTTDKKSDSGLKIM